MPEVNPFALLAAVDDDHTGAKDVWYRPTQTIVYGEQPLDPGRGRAPGLDFYLHFLWLCWVIYWLGGICNHLLLYKLWHTISSEDDLSDAARSCVTGTLLIQKFLLDQVRRRIQHIQLIR